MSLFSFIFISCDSLLQGIAAGMGGYGTMYNPYATPIGVLPYHLQPEVFAEQAKKVAEQSAQQVAQQAAQNAQNVVPVAPVYVPVSSETSTSSSDTHNNNSSFSSSSGARDCGLCHGTGKCNTCNGRGYYDVIGIGSGRHACPNCSNHNGRCSLCNGTGKK